MLDVSELKHFRINHSKLFADEENHINGVENFFKLTGCLKETVADNAAQFSLLNEINQTINDYKTKST